MKHKILIFLYTISEIFVSICTYAQNGASTTFRNTSIDLKGGKTYFAEQICMVTVDYKSGKNVVVWEKTPAMGIKEYQVFKETNVAGDFLQIGTVSFDSIGIFLDDQSNPVQQADRYLIETIDTLGNIMGTSEVHQTIHLAINKGLPGTYNLIWSPYVGFSYRTYYIFKGYSPDNLQLIDSLPSTYIQYTDTATGIAYYQIAVRKNNPCFISKRKSGSEPFSQSVSNLEDNLKYVNIKDASLSLPVKVHPNPFSNEVSIEITISKPSLLKIELYNVLGMKIYEYSTINLISGNYKKIIQASEINNIYEMNILKVTIGDKNYFSKIIKK